MSGTLLVLHQYRMCADKGLEVCGVHMRHIGTPPSGAATPAQPLCGCHVDQHKISWWLGTRWMHSTPVLLADVTIPVPSMGESITEGTIASVLKQPGAWCDATTSACRTNAK